MNIAYKMSVDIIMPAHNPDKNIEKAIESCLAQTYNKVNLTVIDDCSDKSLDYLIDMYPNINMLKTPKNLGPGGARNFGINNTSGDLISFLDDDDVMKPNKVALSVREFIKTPDIGMTCGNYRILVNGRLKRQFYKKPVSITYESLMKQNLVASGSVTISREAFLSVGGFNEKYWICEDYDMWVKISQKFPITYIDDILYFYRIIPGGDSLTQRANIQKNHIKNLNEIKQEARGREILNELRSTEENPD